MHKPGSGKPVVRKPVVKNEQIPTHNKYREVIWPAVVFILAFLLYSNSIPNKYVLDDFGVLKDNWVVKRGIESIPVILKTPYRYGVNMLTDDLYRPASLIMFAVEWEISPNNPSLNHFMNVFLYALSCCLLLVLLRKLFDKVNAVFPLIVSLIWLAHPVHTEVVANIKSRDEILSVLFIFITLIFYTDYLRKKQVLYLVGSVLAYFIAMLSKEGVITMLAVFPLIGWFFTKADLRKIVISSVIMLLPAIGFLIIRKTVLMHYDVPGSISIADNLLVGAPDLSTRFAMILFLLGKYLMLLFIPFQLVSDYSYNQIPITGWSNPLAMVSLLVYSGALVYSILNIKKKSVVAFGILFFLITISIYSNLFMLIGSSFGERFLYLPSLGFAIVVAWVLVLLFQPGSMKHTNSYPLPSLKKSPGIWIAIFILFLLYTSKTFARNHEWYDQWSLFSADIVRSPNSAHLRYYWGLTIRDKAKEQTDPEKYHSMMQQAADEFEKGISIYPNYPECYHQLGLATFRLGDSDKALLYYNKSIELSPNEAVPYANMGIIYFNRGDYGKTMELYRKAISIDPHYADAFCNIGSTFGMLGQYDSAIVNFKKAIEYDPESYNAYYYLGMTYKNMNNPDLAKPYFEKAYELNPALQKQ